MKEPPYGSWEYWQFVGLLRPGAQRYQYSPEQWASIAKEGAKWNAWRLERNQRQAQALFDTLPIKDPAFVTILKRVHDKWRSRHKGE